MLSMTLALAICNAQLGEKGPNLVRNASFSTEFSGWEPIWSREEGAAKASIAAGRSESHKCVIIQHTGANDWSLGQHGRITVSPRQVYEISGWMKSDGGAGTLSVVVQDKAGKVIDWSFGAVQSPRSGWNFIDRSVLTPANAAAIQFRIIGTGPGTTAVETPSIQLIGQISELKAAPVTLSTKLTQVTISSDGALELKAGQVWRFRPAQRQFIGTSLKRLGPNDAAYEALDVASRSKVVNHVHVDSKSGEVDITTTAAKVSQVCDAFPGSLETHSGDSLILPMNEGLRMPVEDETLANWSLITYGGHGLCMPWLGVNDRSGAGLMAIIETPDDADIFFPKEDGLLTFQPRWEQSKGAVGYARSLRLSAFSSGGFVPMAKRYRAYSKAHGLFKTLAQKRSENPNVDRLIGAVNIWNWDMNPVDLCTDLKSKGFAHVLWSRGGTADEIRKITAMGYLPGRYDIYQDVWDPKHSLSWMPTEGWPEDLVLESDGNWMKGWAHPEKQADGSINWLQGGVISSGSGLARAKRKIPEDLAKIPYLARFIDTTTASPFREDYNPAHPLTRSQDREFKMALLDFCSKDMRQVVGTETGIDPSVPVVEYYEGMMSLGPFRLPDAGTFMMEYRKPTPEFLKFQVGYGYRIPLWELVYHDCTVAQWYWGDASNKVPEVWDQRDLLNILYGTAPLLMFDKDRWSRERDRMVQTYRNVCEWNRKIGYDEMLSHEDLTPDHRVQKTIWSSGQIAIVNFGEEPFQGIPAKSFKLTSSNHR